MFMYQCPTCGGELHFDIASQQIKCTYCSSLYNPYQFSNNGTDGVEQQNVFDTTIFTCPQCGGEVYSVENESASFCSYCGASTILTARLNKEIRPTFVIPFKKTKEDCKRAYEARMKKAFFAPKELRDPRYLDSFRGIYMPYWTYEIEQHGNVNVNGTKSFRRGDYQITQHFQLTASIDADYAGFSYDASSSFYDSISENLAPYDTRQLIDFDPTFLLGFYADSADVPYELYLQDAINLSCEQTLDSFKRTPQFSGIALESGSQNAILNVPSNCKRRDRTLFPVWFLTYQTGNRVAYVTVNGQNGKIVADIPVDSKKYTLFSLLLTLPIFGILELFQTTLNSAVMACVATIFAAIVTLLYRSEIEAIYEKDSNEADKGLAFKQTQNVMAAKSVKKRKTQGLSGGFLLGILLFAVIAMILVSTFPTVDSYFTAKVAIAISTVITIFCTLTGLKQNKQIDDTHFAIGNIFCSISSIIAIIIVMTDVASDIPYYTIALAIAASVLITILDIIRNYNILSTRKLPQFNKKGGNHNAY